MALTLTGPLTGKITVRAETAGGAPAPLPGPVSWGASDGSIAELSVVPDRPDQVAVSFVGVGAVTIVANSAELSGSLDFVIETPIPVAEKLILEFTAD